MKHLKHKHLVLLSFLLAFLLLFSSCSLFRKGKIYLVGRADQSDTGLPYGMKKMGCFQFQIDWKTEDRYQEKTETIEWDGKIYNGTYSNTSRYSAEKGVRIDYTCVEPEIQIKDYWCWVTCARMLARYYYPSITASQSDGVWHVKNSYADDTGILLETISAIQYYISTVSNDMPSLQSGSHEIYESDVLCHFLDDGYLMIVARGHYNGFGQRLSGHDYLLCGYCLAEDTTWFIVADSSSSSVYGNKYLISYNKLVNGAFSQGNEGGDDGIWDGFVAFETSYSDNTIPYYLDQ